MKQFFKNFCLVALVVYSIIAFVSFLPNVADWGNAGRGAYLFIVILFSAVGTAITEETNRK